VTAYKYAAAGAKLIISARSHDKLSAVKTAALKHGASSVHIVPQDFSKVEEIASFRDRVLAIHPTIDILLLNHAGMPLGPWTSFPKQQTAEHALRTFNINVLSFIELTRLFLGELEASAGLIQVGAWFFFHRCSYSSAMLLSQPNIQYSYSFAKLLCRVAR